MTWTRWFSAAALWPCLLACSRASETATSCENDLRADVFEPWLERQSAAGSFTLVLDRTTPAPPQRGLNEWAIRLVGSGAPDRVRMRAWLPDHARGTTPLWHEARPLDAGEGGAGEGGAGERGAGQGGAGQADDRRYDIGPFDLFMDGLWELTVEVTQDDATDDAAFAFCVEGRANGGAVESCDVVAPTACATPGIDFGDIEPIIANRCVTCHDGTGDEWPLDSYTHVIDWKDDIRSRMLDCTMPPPDSEVTMTLAERRKLLDWLRCGAAE